MNHPSTPSTSSIPSSSPEIRALRRLIQAHRIKRLGWSDYVFHYVMSGLGFGTSLTALSYDQLNQLWSALRSYRKSGLPYEFSYNRWGNYMFALQKKAGWDDATLRGYLLVTYKKSHWNLLTYKEKKELITLLQSLSSTPSIESTSSTPSNDHNQPNMEV